jgi:lambda repressor-like predicted transcriptional regulator
MAAAYRAGATLTDISAQAHLARETVRELLVGQGVAIRPPGHQPPRMTPQEIAAAYLAGATLRNLARRAKVADRKVRALLVDQGVQIRARVTDKGGPRPEPKPRMDRKGPLGPEELARLRAAVGIKVVAG